MTTCATIAEAVKAALNAAPSGTFNAAFTAVRTYTPVAKLESLGTLRVFVLAKGDTAELATRAHSDSAMPIDVVVMKRVTADPATEAANVELDALVELARQISTFFKPAAALGATGATWSDSKTSLVYDTERLKGDGKVFLSVITLTFDLRFDHR